MSRLKMKNCLCLIPVFRMIMICVLALLTSSCINSTLKGYKRIYPRIHYKLHQFGAGEEKLSENDLVTIHVSYSTTDDSVFFRRVRKIRLEDPGFNNSVYSCIMRLHQGDSASFIFRTSDLFVKNLKTSVPEFLQHHKRIKMNVSVLDVQTSAGYEAEKKQFLQWARDMKQAEIKILENFLDQQRISVNPDPDGMYFILTKVGRGERPVKGDLVSIKYEGKFMDGRYFDTTQNNAESFDFIYGQEYMVIKGIEKAVGMMREGDNALIILPSELAFGSTGAGEGVIPPFTALIYELELLKVRKIKSL